MNIKKKISICMMIKDEEKNLYRCLNSLKPILDSGLGELIIVDTGSKDNSVKVAREYTEKVFEHPWNNNFSEMRNISISYAKGEWIWIMDADEEIENPHEMIKLLQSNLNNYNTIIVKMKNYIKAPRKGEKDKYNTSVLLRGFRNNKGFKYEGRIHEQPQYKLPFISSNIVIGHYGYMWEDEELKKRKFERTVSILKTEVEEKPSNVYYQFQLGAAYSIVDIIAGLKETRKAYSIMKKLSNLERGEYGYVYGTYANLAFKNKNYTETIQVCKEGLDYNKEYIDLWYYLGMSCIFMRDDENGLIALEEFIKYKEQFESTLISKNPAYTFYCLDDSCEELAMYFVALIYNEKNDANKVFHYISKMKTSDLKSEAVSIIGVKKNIQSVLFDYLNEIQDEEEIRNGFRDIIEKLEIDDGVKIRYINNIIEFYCMNQQTEDSYLWLNYIRKGIIEGTKVDDNVIDKIIKVDFEELDDYYGDIIAYVIKQQLEFSILQDIDPQVISRFMRYVITKYENIDEEIISYLERIEKNDDINNLRNWISFARYPLLREKLDDYNYKDLFLEYVDKGIKYIDYIYSHNVLSEDNAYNINDGEHRFFIYLARAYKVKQKDKKMYIKLLRKALKSYPMKKGIKMLLEEVLNESAKIESNDNNQSEFEAYKKLVKNNINLLIETKQIGEAKAIIDEYLQIVPNDTEMLMLKSEVQQFVM